jgi:hypothetical protein
VQFPAPPFEHLLRLSDDLGVFEHAVLAKPARSHSYCTDDVARALVVLMREPRRTASLEPRFSRRGGFSQQREAPGAQTSEQSRRRHSGRLLRSEIDRVDVDRNTHLRRIYRGCLTTRAVP